MLKAVGRLAVVIGELTVVGELAVVVGELAVGLQQVLQSVFEDVLAEELETYFVVYWFFFVVFVATKLYQL